MNMAIYNIVLDIHKTGSQAALPMTRGENKRKIVISLMENGRPYKIVNGCSAVFTAIKPDGKFIYNDCEIDLENNLIIYNVTSQTTAAMGEVKCQLKLIGSDGGLLFSPVFSLIVSDTLYNEQPILESSEEFNGLTKFLAELKENKQDKLTAGDGITIDGNVISASSGGSGVVDQTYNPTSENAQSGFAVAEAIENKSYVDISDLYRGSYTVLGGSAVNGMYELIKAAVAYESYIAVQFHPINQENNNLVLQLSDVGISVIDRYKRFIGMRHLLEFNPKDKIVRICTFKDGSYKQDKLIAGDNITIDENNVISASSGGSGVVDQTYTPESENAQSGKAVAQAISNAIGGVNTVFGLIVEGDSNVNA